MRLTLFRTIKKKLGIQVEKKLNKFKNHEAEKYLVVRVLILNELWYKNN